ncbi:MAG: AtpZ/AtpI family protein [Thermoanaerobaculum sp.]|nr:AtpZ/AtpI family protein [Thermoanaerobaculum sp.]MCX7895514.1 AtpZ/AtpI family protein [Thermoanaerobaculum sp.]MDW7967343.1 AtpZ/AtpI family protein [Thermoanaerobaculum sp.]
MREPGERKKRLDAARRLAEASSIGIAFPLALGIGYLWGSWMDGVFGTKPYLTWIFSGLGVVAGFVNAIRLALRVAREEEREQR